MFIFSHIDYELVVALAEKRLESFHHIGRVVLESHEY